MIRSYSFQNPRAFPMACATFETTAQKTLGTLACRDIWWSSFRWNASDIVFSYAANYLRNEFWKDKIILDTVFRFKKKGFKSIYFHLNLIGLPFLSSKPLSFLLVLPDLSTLHWWKDATQFLSDLCLLHIAAT